MAFFEVERTKCTKDNVCINVCVAGIITKDADGYPVIEEKRTDKCIACGHCVAFCPHDACSVGTLDKSKFIPVDSKMFPTREQVQTLIGTRRSIRNFRKEPVEQATINEILTLISVAPTAKNAQPVKWSVILNRERMVEIGDRMAAAYKEKAAVATDPKMKSLYTVMAAVYTKGRDVFLRNAPCMVIALSPKDNYWTEDGTVATTYFELAAHGYNLGTCWAGYFVELARTDEQLRKISGVPEDMNICGALLLGKPVYKMIKRIPPRKNLEVTWIE